LKNALHPYKHYHPPRSFVSYLQQTSLPHTQACQNPPSTLNNMSSDSDNTDRARSEGPAPSTPESTAAGGSRFRTKLKPREAWPPSLVSGLASYEVVRKDLVPGRSVPSSSAAQQKLKAASSMMSSMKPGEGPADTQGEKSSKGST